MYLLVGKSLRLVILKLDGILVRMGLGCLHEQLMHALVRDAPRIQSANAAPFFQDLQWGFEEKNSYPRKKRET